MAFQLDSRIPMMASGVDIAGNVASGIQRGGMISQLQEAKEQAPLRQQMLQDQAAQSQLATQQAQQAQQLADQDRVIGSIASTWTGVKGLVDAGNFNEAADALEANKQNLAASGVTNFEDSDLAIQALRSGDAKQINAIKAQGNEAIRLATERGIFDANKPTTSTGQRERADLIAQLKPALDKDGKIDPAKLDANSRSAAVALNLIPGAGTATGGERIATTEGLTEVVAKSEERLKGAAETGKLKAQKSLLPGIRASIKQAEQQAQSRGETFTELNSAKAALPGLKTVVGNLKALSGDATFTLAGRGFNAVAKELGFSTKGSTARAAMVSMVDNQVLPLLKPIFGAAFTAIEGDRLRNAFLDPNSTPDSRVASLNAFQDQMERNIESKQREIDITNVDSLNQQLGQQREEASPAQPQDTGVTEAQFRNMSPEQQAQVIQTIQSRGQ